MNGGPSPQPITPEDFTTARMYAQACHYFSTYCIHGFHADHPDQQCRENCKFCHAPCRCDCHLTDEEADSDA